jgi:hypothetical protein
MKEGQASRPSHSQPPSLQRQKTRQRRAPRAQERHSKRRELSLKDHIERSKELKKEGSTRMKIGRGRTETQHATDKFSIKRGKKQNGRKRRFKPQKS